MVCVAPQRLEYQPQSVRGPDIVDRTAKHIGRPVLYWRRDNTFLNWLDHRRTRLYGIEGPAELTTHRQRASGSESHNE